VNIKAAYIHIIGDMIQSVGVVLAALTIYFNPTWTVVDPICTFLFSILVMFTTVNVTKECLSNLLETNPERFDITDIIKISEKVYLF
jgi:zinc transporter 2